MVKVLNKDYNRYYLQKKCIQLILLKTITNSVWAYLSLNGIEIYKFKAKDSKIVAAPLCLGNISNDWAEHYMESYKLWMWIW